MGSKLNKFEDVFGGQDLGAVQKGVGPGPCT